MPVLKFTASAAAAALGVSRHSHISQHVHDGYSSEAVMFPNCAAPHLIEENDMHLHCLNYFQVGLLTQLHFRKWRVLV